MPADWNLKGQLLGACNCDWGCPCSFDAPPTKGFCDGVYVWHVTRGRFSKTRLDELSFGIAGHSPGPLHLGNVTWQPIIEQRADAEQRTAILELLSGREGGPWRIFASVASKIFDPIFARMSVKIDGLKSRARAANVVDIQLEPIRNPVTGKIEELRLVKPTGFTSKWADLGRTRKMTVAAPELSYDHSGQYAEFSEFSYASGK
jgi:hypothetical protein